MILNKTIRYTKERQYILGVSKIPGRSFFAKMFMVGIIKVHTYPQEHYEANQLGMFAKDLYNGWLLTANLMIPSIVRVRIKRFNKPEIKKIYLKGWFELRFTFNGYKSINMLGFIELIRKLFRKKPKITKLDGPSLEEFTAKVLAEQEKAKEMDSIPETKPLPKKKASKKVSKKVAKKVAKKITKKKVGSPKEMNTSKK